jgi:hypothetical protein
MIDKYKSDNFLDMRFYYENFSPYNSVILLKHYTNLMKLFNWNVKNGLDPNKMTIYKTDCQLTLALSSKMYDTIKFKLKDEYTKTDYIFDKVKVSFHYEYSGYENCKPYILIYAKKDDIYSCYAYDESVYINDDKARHFITLLNELDYGGKVEIMFARRTDEFNLTHVVIVDKTEDFSIQDEYNEFIENTKTSI